MKFCKIFGCVLGACFLFGVSAKADFSKPDFAYPRTVFADAAKVLSSGSEQERLVALMQQAVAAQAIDPQGLSTFPTSFDSLAGTFSQPQLRALSLAYGASLYSRLAENRYGDAAVAVLPLPQKVADYTAKQLKYCADSLWRKAMDEAVSDDAPLSDFKAVVVTDSITDMFYPTITSFISLQSRNPELAAEAAEFQPRFSPAWWRCMMMAEPDRPLDSWLHMTASDPRRKAALMLAGYADSGNFYNGDSDTEIYRNLLLIQEYYGDSAVGEWIRKMLNFYNRPFVTVSAPTIAAVGQSLDLLIQSRAVKNPYVTLWRYKGNGEPLSYKLDGAQYEFVLSRGTECNPLPGCIDTGNVSITMPAKVGYYILTPSDRPIKRISKNTDFTVISVVQAVPVILSTDSLTNILAVSPVDGRPVRNASAYETAYSVTKKSSVRKSLGSFSNKSGAMQLILPTYTQKDLNTSGKRSPRIQLLVDGVVQPGVDCSLPVYSQSYTTQALALHVITDRAVYRQGQTVAVAVVADSLVSDVASVASGVKVELTLTDTNGNSVDNTVLVTDSMGRAAGELKIPADGLKGTFRITASCPGTSVRAFGTVEVAQFTAPSFEVKIDTVERTDDRTVIITGNASYYNGMPVADATVSVDVKQAWRYGYLSDQEFSYTDTTRTDTAGKFKITIDPRNLTASEGITVPGAARRSYSGNTTTAGSRFYTAELNVTAPDGEIVSTSTGFSTGAPYTLSLKGETEWLPAEKTGTRMPLSLTDAMGKPVAYGVPLQLRFTGGIDTIFSTVSTVEKLDLSALPAGDYTCTVTAVPSELADTLTFNTHIYSIERNQLPDGVKLFVPKKNIKTSAGATVCVSVGQSISDNAYLYIMYPDGALSMKRIRRGFTDVEVKMPVQGVEAQAIMAVMVNGNLYSNKVDFELEEAQKVEVETLSFRDKIEPGTKEHWTFRLRSGSETLTPVAGVATMFSEALTQLKPYYIPTLRYIKTYVPDFRQLSPYSFNNIVSWYAAVNERVSSSIHYAPAFTYFPLMHQIRIRGTKSYAAANGSYNEVVMVESAPMMYQKAAATADLAMAVEMEDTIEEPFADGGQMSETTVLREHEVLQALWSPMLSSDSEGVISVDFTVPNAQQTWNFSALLWDKNMKSASVVKKVVASKEVMASIKVPQWLRVGDKAVIICTLGNNMAEESDIAYTCEAFIPGVSDSVLFRQDGTVSVASQATEFVPFTIEVPAEYTAIGLRIMASGKEHSDGEQALVAVLPNEMGVTDVNTFFMGSGENSVTIDGIKDINKLKVELWDNPTGILLKALPGLYELSNSTATEAARSLFRATVSAGLLAHNPEWEGYTSKISSGEADVPSLAEDNAYKLSLLQSTPWMRAAKGIEARRELLKLLLDPVEVNKSLAQARQALTSLQTSDGGYRWSDADSKPSLWATGQVLLYSAMIHDCGFAVNDPVIDASLQKAFRYYSSKVVASQKRYYNKLQPDVTLTAICLSNPQFRPDADAKEIIKLTTEQIQKTWKNDGTGQKAKDALYMNTAGKKDLAREIMGSVEQFAVTSAEWGVWFPSVKNVDSYADILRAYQTILNNPVQTDDIRRYLIHRALTMPELGSNDATSLIAAFLNTGSEWSLITPDFKVNNAYDGLRITRESSATPAYGTISTSRVLNSKDVKASKCAELSVQRQINVKQPDGSYKLFREGKDILTAGAQVRIDIILTASDDLEYITVQDPRPAVFQPELQLSGYRRSGGLGMYADNVAGGTNFFISSLPRGTWHVTYDCQVVSSGAYVYPSTRVQSQYQPAVQARTAAGEIRINQMGR